MHTVFCDPTGARPGGEPQGRGGGGVVAEDCKASSMACVLQINSEYNNPDIIMQVFPSKFVERGGCWQTMQLHDRFRLAKQLPWAKSTPKAAAVEHVLERMTEASNTDQV